MSTRTLRVLLLAAVLGSGTICRSGAWGAPDPKMTADEERRLAVKICTAAWEELSQTDSFYREYFLVPLAVADPERAEALAASVPADPRQRARAFFLEGWLRAEPQVAALRLENETEPGLLLKAARLLYAQNADRAAELLTRAARAIREQPGGGNPYRMAEAAALAREIEHPGASGLAAEAVARATEICRQAAAVTPRVTWSSVRWALAVLAAADPEAALKLAEAIPDEAERAAACAVVAARGLARSDPARACAVLDAHRPAPESLQAQESLTWSQRACEAALVLAERDPARAEALARRIPRPDERAVALAGIARCVPVERAAGLRREALAAAAEPGQRAVPGTLAQVAALLPPGPERRDACAQALEVYVREDWHTSQPEVPGTIAFTLATDDPESARALLEDALADCPPDARGYDAHARRKALIMAFCVLDPRCALAEARKMPAGRPEVLRKIAEYLVATPEVRAGIQFDCWRDHDIWTRREEVEW